MGLKFRRGTTAQKSGSLAFGEPYVNTDLGTLQIGGATGDITLGASGTGSAGQFSSISGSSLEISGNASVGGNLTVGGQLQIGDNSSDTVNVVASLSSSLIPQTTNVFDLGSATKIWRDLYISTGSIKFVEGNTVVKSLSAATLTALEVATGSSNVSVAALNSFTSSIDTTTKNKMNTDGVISGSSQITYASISSIPVGIVSGSSQTIANLPTGVVSGSTQTIANLPAGVVSGSSQIDITSTTGFSTYSTSVDSRITTEKGRVDAILSASSADKDSFAEIVTLINSVDTTNDSGFASFYTASVGRLNNLETTSGSVNISVSNLNTYTGSNDTTNGTQNTRLTALEASASTALSTNGTQATSITNLNSATASLMIETANLETFSSSALTRLDNLEGKDISITLTGDVTGTGTITNLANVSFATTIAADSVALGTDTTGNYVASLVAGTNITLSNNSGEGATPTIGLTNNSTTIGTTAIALGASSTTLAGLTSVSSTGFTGALTGNASTATTLATARNINGVSFNGSADITVTAAAGTLSGATLASGVTASSLTSVGTLTSLTVTGAITANGGVAVTGALTATGDITAYYSDGRLKENLQVIPNALEKVSKLTGYTYNTNALGKQLLNNENDNDIKVGVIAQDLQEVLPQAVKFAPFDRDAEGNSKSGENYLTVQYEKIVPLLIQAIKEQQTQIHSLTLEIEKLKEPKGL